MLIVTGILTAIYAARENSTLQGAQQYNVFFYSFTQVIFLETFLIAMLAIYFAGRLVRELKTVVKSSNNNLQQSQLEKLVEKLKFSRITFFWAGFAFAAFVQIEFFLYIFLGSVPYEFIFSVFFNLNFSFPAILVLIKQNDAPIASGTGDTVPSLSNTAASMMSLSTKLLGGRRLALLHFRPFSSKNKLKVGDTE